MKILKKRWLAFVSAVFIVIGVAFVATSPATAAYDNGSEEVCYEQVSEAQYKKFTAPTDAGPWTLYGTWWQGQADKWWPDTGEVVEGPANHPDGRYTYRRVAQQVVNGDEIPCAPEPAEPTVSLTASAECDGVISGSVGFTGGYDDSVAFVRLFHGIEGSNTGVEVNLGDELSIPGSVPFTIPAGVYDEADKVLITATVLFLFEGEGLEYFDNMVVEVPTCSTTTPPTTAPPTTAPPVTTTPPTTPPTTAPPATTAPPVTTVPATPPTPTTQPPPATTPILPNTGIDSPGGINPIGIALILIGLSGVALYFVRRRLVS